MYLIYLFPFIYVTCVLGYRFALYGFSNEKEVLTELQERTGDEVFKNTEMKVVVDVNINNLVELLPSDIPVYGYYGFNFLDIRIRIESQEAADLCEFYQSFTANLCRQEILQQLVNERNALLANGEMKNLLHDVIRKERWYFERQRYLPETPISLSTVADDMKLIEMSQQVGFLKLFSSEDSKKGEILLSIWDLIEGIGKVFNEDFTFSLLEVLSCVDSLTHKYYPSPGYVVFDEMGCLFTSFILEDCKYSYTSNIGYTSSMTLLLNNNESRTPSYVPLAVDDMRWNKAMAMNPLNILTWPQVYRNAILASRTIGWSIDQSLQLLTRPIYNQVEATPYEVLVLLSRHPLLDIIHTFYSTETFPVFSKLKELRNQLVQKRDLSVNVFYTEILNIFSTNIVVSTDEVVLGVLNLIFKQLRSWLQALFHRLDDSLVVREEVEIDEEVDDIQFQNVLNQHVQEVFSDKSLNDKKVLMPYHFNPYNDILTNLSSYPQLFERRLDQLQVIEKTLVILRKESIDSWSVEDKFEVLNFSLTWISTSWLFNKVVCSNQSLFNLTLFNKIDDIPVLPPSITQRYTDPSSLYTSLNTKMEDINGDCCFTGEDLKQLASNSRISKVVIVPDKYHQSIRLSKPKEYIVNDYNLESSNERYLTLETSLLRIISAREMAVLHLEEAEKRTMEFISLFDMNANQATSINPAVWSSTMPIQPLRSSPLGYDRHGSSYWLLSAQESMTILSMGAYTVRNHLLYSDGNDALSSLPSQPYSTDPSILIRHKSGWWGYHNGKNMSQLLMTFSSSIECERILAQNLVHRYIYTRGKLYSTTLRSKTQQREWLLRKIALSELLEKTQYLDHLAGSEGNKKATSLNDVMKQIEVIYVRCAEVRQNAHYSMLLKKDFDHDRPITVRTERDTVLRRIRRIRESNSDNTYDLHHQLGYLRHDCISRVLQLSASTTASRIHADYLSLNLIHANNMKSSFRTMWLNDTIVKTTSSDQVATSNNVDNVNNIDGVVETEIQVMEVDPIVPSNEIDTSNVIATSNTSKEKPIEIVNEDKTSSKNVPIESEGVIEVEETSTKPILSPGGDANAGEVVGETDDVINDLPNRDDSNYEDALYASSRNSKKPIEQYDMSTGETLRIYPSGRVAAQFMLISHGSISLCCSGKQNEAFGFGWRFYDGPPIESWEALKPKQLSLLKLLEIGAARKKFISLSRQFASEPGKLASIVAANSPLKSNHGSISIVASPTNIISNGNIAKNETIPHVSIQPNVANTSIASIPIPIPSSLPRAIPLPVVPSVYNNVNSSQGNFRHVTNIISSTVIVTPRFLKLKTELLNLYLCLPEKALKWKELEEFSANVIIPENETSEAKSIRKRKKREVRKAITEKFIQSIQLSSNATSLFKAMQVLEEAIPTIWYLSYDIDSLPCISSNGNMTFASIALRVYILDRLIRYDDISGIEVIGSKVAYRPRVQYTPKCMLTPLCKLGLNHMHKCVTMDSNSNNSRFTEVSDNFVPLFTTSNSSQYSGVGTMNRPIPSTLNSVNRSILVQNIFGNTSRSSSGGGGNVLSRHSSSHSRKFGKGEEEEIEFEDEPLLKKGKLAVNIEFTHPFVPNKSKMSSFDSI